MEKTFSMIKPEAVLGGNAGKIMTAVEESGLKIVAQKMLRLSPEQAGSFYGLFAQFVVYYRQPSDLTDL